MTARILVLLVGLVLCGSPPVRTEQPPALSTVLRRAGAYVEEFQRQLSGIVAEESYVQEVVPFLGLNARGRIRFERRTLRSDLLLLRPEGAVTWVQFRDVFDVDGRPVRDREERLTALFLAPGQSSTDRAQQVRAESARYNIGGIPRTMNVPVLPLAVLVPAVQSRFRFTLAGTGDSGRFKSRVEGAPPAADFRAEVAVLSVRFEEREGPTLVRTTAGADIFSRGRFWIEPESGRVLESEMITEDRQVRGELAVSYQSQPGLGFLVPLELRERYSDKGYAATITGEATYSNFRRFQVDVDEVIGPIR